MEMGLLRTSKLDGTTAYLSGAIEACQDKGTSWRQRLTPELRKFGITIWDPLVKPKWVPQINGARQASWKQMLIDPYAGHEELTIGEAVTIADSVKLAFEQNKFLRNICCALANQCNIMIVKIDKATFTVGTWEEVVIGQRRGIPMFFICSDPIPSMWLVDMFRAYEKPKDVFFQTEEALITHFNRIEDGSYEVDNIAWAFKTYCP